MDLYVKYPTLLTADAWHLRTKGEWIDDTEQAFAECRLIKERRYAAESGDPAPEQAQNEGLDEAWILPNELLPEAVLERDSVRKGMTPEETEASYDRPGPIHVD